MYYYNFPTIELEFQAPNSPTKGARNQLHLELRQGQTHLKRYRISIDRPHRSPQFANEAMILGNFSTAVCSTKRDESKERIYRIL
jgi:hypothetical protein